MKKAVLAACAAVSISACTTELEVTRVPAGTDPPVTGWVYSLPYTRFDVTVTRTFVGCEKGASTPGYKYALTSVASNHADPEHTYSVNYDSLSSPLKTSDLKLTWGDNRTLTAINAAATDKTGDVIVNIVTGAAKLATLVATGGAGGKGGTAFPCEQQIQPKIQEALKLRESLSAQVDGIGVKLQEATARLTGLTGLASQLGQRVDPRIQSNALTAAEHVIALKQEQQTAATKVAENEKLLVESITFNFPESGNLDADGTQTRLVGGGTKALTNWVTSGLRTEDGFRTAVQIRRTGRVVAAKTNPSGTPKAGLAYRVPVEGGIWLCHLSRPENESVHRSDEAPTEAVPDCASTDFKPSAPVAIPQLGRVAVLRFRNGPFEDNAIAATFAADGSITMAEYKVNSSSAANATSAFSQAVSQAAAGAKGVVGAQATIDTAKTTALKAQSELITAKAASTYSDQLALIQSNTSLLKAQADQISAEQALAKARAAGGT